MPSRVFQHHTREESPPSDSEKSFVSATSENTSNRLTKDPPIGQSAAVALPSPSHSAIAPSDFTSFTTPQLEKEKIKFSTGIQACSPSSSTEPTPLAPPLGSYFAPQPGASGSEARSPQIRRPPASRSSHGIETSSGPPPALSTRRSYNADSPWRSPPPSDPRAVYYPTVHSANIDSVVRQTHHTATDHIENNDSEGLRPAQLRKSSVVDGGVMATDGRYEMQSESEEDQDPTLRINGNKTETGRHIRNQRSQQLSGLSHEDLFLNLARTDSAIDDGPESSSNRNEGRRSRLRVSSLQRPRESQPTSSHRPSTSVGGAFGQRVSPMQHNDYESSFNPSLYRPLEKRSPASFRDSPGKARSYAASAHPLEQQYRTSNTRTSFAGSTRNGLVHDRSPEMSLGTERQRSICEPSPGSVSLGDKQSNVSYTPNGDYRSSYLAGHHQERGYEADQDPQLLRAEGTESTVSTTAPSTVWDELEDMKSRIRKLELTGKLPASSSAAMSSTFRDRPPTATTTMTTDSLSPNRRHVKSVSPEASTVKALEVTNLHPLLHDALAKTKATVNTNLYKALEATASDALTLAAMAGSASAQGISPRTTSIAGTSKGIDRQLSRKADNMCRSLTELCIALAEESSISEIAVGNIQPGSKEANAVAQQDGPSSQEPRSYHASSDEPGYRSSSRVMSRLEARRTSLALGSSPLGRSDSPKEAPTPTLDRKSSVIHRSRPDEDHGGNTTTSSRRPLSRATTEIGQTRSSPQIRTPREYTSQHPMPKNVQRSPSVQSSLPTRKTYFPAASQSPFTPNMQPGNRRYVGQSTPPLSADSSRLAEARQRRIASLGQHTSASQSRIGLASGRLQQPEIEQ